MILPSNHQLIETTMKKCLLSVVAVFAAVLTSCTTSGTGSQKAKVHGPVYGDVTINQTRQEEIRRNSPGNSAQLVSQRRDEVVLGGPPPVRHSSNSGSSGYRGSSGSVRRSSAPVPTGRYVSGYHVERHWDGGGTITIPPGARPIATGVARHWEGWGTGPDGSREGVIIEHQGYQGPHVPWGAPSGPSSAPSVSRFGYGN